MTGVTGPEGKTTRYEYDADGNMTKTLREDGETTILYDRQGQITALANTKDGQTISVYTYGLQRETYTMTAALNGVGDTIPGMTTENSGTYYYTGTGSVANLINRNGRNTSCTYTPDGIKTVHAMNAPGSTDLQGKTTHPKQGTPMKTTTITGNTPTQAWESST